VYLYAPIEEIEEAALQQLVKVAETAMPVGFVAAMPDVHWGKGVTIGTVFASEVGIDPWHVHMFHSARTGTCGPMVIFSCQTD